MRSLSNATKYPRVVARALAMFTCDWCSVDDSTRYIRFSGPGASPSEDWVHLCDECAKLLRDAITRRLRESR